MLTFRSMTRVAIAEYIHNHHGCRVWSLDTKGDGADDTLVGYDTNEVKADIAFYRDEDMPPTHWELTDVTNQFQKE